MASNVLKLRRPDQLAEPAEMLESVSIRGKPDVLDAAIAFDRIARNRGMRITMWHDISSQEPMVDADGQALNSRVFGCDAQDGALWEDYDKALRSQLIRACRVESEPFWVNRDGFRTRWQNEFLAEIDLEDFEARSLVKAAIVVPLHLPFGQIAAVVFTSLDQSREDLSGEFAQYGQMLSDLARRFVAGYVNAMRDNPYLPTENVLTSREIQCLRWAAFGKTDFEISMILECSHATVRYHIKRTCDKLGAVNRAQSIFRACQLGYIGAVN